MIDDEADSVSMANILQDLKYLRVELSEKETRPMAMPRVMWDKDLHFLTTQSHHILDSANTNPQIQNFPGWRLCRYLSFVDDEGYISGLTVYCDHHRITGMISHGNSIRMMGHRQGCPIHFPLRHQERIVSAWLRTPGDTICIMLEPTLLVSLFSSLLLLHSILTHNRSQLIITVRVYLGHTCHATSPVSVGMGGQI